MDRIGKSLQCHSVVKPNRPKYNKKWKGLIENSGKSNGQVIYSSHS